MAHIVTVAKPKLVEDALASLDAAVEAAEIAAEAAETAAGSVEFPVSYGVEQTLTSEQQDRGRENVSAERAPFLSRSEAEATAVPDSIRRISVLHAGLCLDYVADENGNALETADGRTWSPNGQMFAKHWGALEDYDWSEDIGTDDAALIQKAIDWVEGNGGGELYIDGLAYTSAPVIASPSVFLMPTRPTNGGRNQVGTPTWPPSFEVGSGIIASHVEGPVVISTRYIDAIFLGSTQDRYAADISTGGRNTNCGLLIEPADEPGAIIIRAEAVRTVSWAQPADGFMICGNVVSWKLDAVTAVNCKRHGWVADNGELAGRTNKYRPGIGVVESPRLINLGGHGECVGHPDSGTDVPYRIDINNSEYFRIGNDPDLMHAPAAGYYLGEQIFFKQSAAAAYSGFTGDTPTYAHAIAFGGRMGTFTSNRYIRATEEPFLVLPSPWSGSEETKLLMQAGYTSTPVMPRPVNFFKVQSGSPEIFATFLAGTFTGFPIDKATFTGKCQITHGDEYYQQGYNSVIDADISVSGNSFVEGNSRVGGITNLNPITSASTIIADGVISFSRTYTIVDTEGATAADDLTTITGGVDGDIMILRSATSSRVVTIKDNTGIRTLYGDITLDRSSDRVILQKIGSNWFVIAQSTPGSLPSIWPRTSLNNLAYLSDSAGGIISNGTYRAPSGFTGSPFAGDAIIHWSGYQVGGVPSGQQIAVQVSDGSIKVRNCNSGTRAAPDWSEWTIITGTPSHTVDWWFSEVPHKPLEQMYVTWCSDSAAAREMEWSFGAGWAKATAFRSRPYREWADKWLHTAELDISSVPPDEIITVRSPGADYQDTIKKPRAAEATILFASDWQINDYTVGSRLGVFGDVISTEGVDLAIFGGDLMGSSIAGYYPTEAYAEIWHDFMTMLTTHYRTTGGAQIPWVFQAGNHEARDGQADTSAYNGDGIYVGIDVVATAGFYPRQHNLHIPGAMDLYIPNLLHITMLETHHGQPLQAQLGWFEETLELYSSRVPHAFVMGHVPPFNIGGAGVQYAYDGARILRNQFWTVAQEHPNVKAWIAGHSHGNLITQPLKMDFDPLMSAEDNDVRFYSDVDGIIQIVTGAIGAPIEQSMTRLDQISSIDGDPIWSAFLGRDNAGVTSSYQIRGDILIGPSGLGLEDLRSVMIINVTPEDWGAKLINQNGNTIWES